MKFEEYMESKLPGYETVIGEDKIEEMKGLYSEYITYFNAARENINQQFKTKADLDFSNDYQKNQDRAIKAKVALDNKIEEVKNELNKEEEKQSMSW